MEGHRRSWKVMEDQGRSWMVFSHPWIDISGEKSYWWGGGGVVACRIIVSAPVPFLFLWTLDFGFGTWIWDLDLGLDLGLTIKSQNQIKTINLKLLISCLSTFFDQTNKKGDKEILRLHLIQRP